ncbi:polysaccharide deacetylase family protein [Paucibacter sp. APW11]|uniref:Polysaccharide deacetylase family protein n=1 Tax=Roseateles aquae TaxID=3077235 RepID=A0ABU3PHX2_9BURK|nr:polysaccharide deacetylase family protein [Paucibacter sp. APW11]MDT9001591.1 polysaccharide deacetylase family protein [Paucibacter sp. APW11]
MPNKLKARLDELLSLYRDEQLLAQVSPQDPRHAQAQAALYRIRKDQQAQTQKLVASLTAAAHAGQIEPLQELMAVAGAVSRTELPALRPLLSELRLQTAWHGSLHEQLLVLFQQLRVAADGDERQRWLQGLEQQQDIEQRLSRHLGNTPLSIEDLHLARAAREREWHGLELPARTVLLSFDDGPHPVHTPAILKTLGEHGLKAMFFQVGRNLGERENGQAIVKHNQEIVAQVIAGGHAIGNHSYSHPQMSKLGEAAIDEEIDLTQQLLDQLVPAGPARTGMFRAPYGALNEQVLAELEQRHLRLVLWNIDSMDWADPSPASIVQRVLEELDHAGRGIVLMHDIHQRSAEALPLLIKQLRARGYRFAHWDGQALVVTEAEASGGTATHAEQKP